MENEENQMVQAKDQRESIKNINDKAKSTKVIDLSSSIKNNSQKSSEVKQGNEYESDNDDSLGLYLKKNGSNNINIIRNIL